MRIKWHNIPGSNYYVSSDYTKLSRYLKKTRQYLLVEGSARDGIMKNYQIRVNQQVKTFNMHHLVWIVFVDPEYKRGNGFNIIHKDGDLTNNNPNNLMLIPVSSKPKRLSKKVKLDNCQDCNKTFNEKNRGSRGRCKMCYQRWRNKNGYLECKGCGTPTPTRPLIPYCRMCRRLGKIENYSEDNAPDFNIIRRKLEQRLSRKTIEQKQNILDPSISIKEEAKYVLLKFKYGNYSIADIYRLISIYIEIWGLEAAIDNYDIESQLIFMLKRLKMFWDDKLINI